MANKFSLGLVIGGAVSPTVGAAFNEVTAVSYTHLTLPTNREV